MKFLSKTKVEAQINMTDMTDKYELITVEAKLWANIILYSQFP